MKSLSAYIWVILLVGFARPGGLHFTPPKVRANPTRKKWKLFWFRKPSELVWSLKPSRESTSNRTNLSIVRYTECSNTFEGWRLKILFWGLMLIVKENKLVDHILVGGGSIVLVDERLVFSLDFRHVLALRLIDRFSIKLHIFGSNIYQFLGLKPQ